MEEICDEKCKECAAVGMRRPTGDNDQQQQEETPHRYYLQQRAWRAQATLLRTCRMPVSTYGWLNQPS